MNENSVEYEIVIKPFKTEDDANMTVANICDELRMDRSIFFVRQLLDGEEIEFIISELQISKKYCDTDEDKDYYNKILEKLSGE